MNARPSLLHRLLFWNYPRGSKQYDLIVILILAFLFLTPRELFRDQPRGGSIVLMPAEGSSISPVFWVEPDLLTSTDEQHRLSRAADLVRSRFPKSPPVIRLEAISGEEHELKGFMAFTRP